MDAIDAFVRIEWRPAHLAEPSNTRDASVAWFESIGRRELDRAYRLAGLILGNATEAEDATQEALLRAWKQRRSLRDPDRAQAWFDRILVNVCRDRLRRRRPIVDWADVWEGSHNPAIDPFVALHQRDEVMGALATLSADHRIVLVLRYWADLPVADIAERLDVPAGTVKSRLYYAHDAIRSALETS
jgi:RNA polymerase sigma-70 factor, ECF subfamily